MHGFLHCPPSTALSTQTANEILSDLQLELPETTPASRLTCSDLDCPTRAILIVLQRRCQIKIRTAAKVLTGQGALVPGVREGDWRMAESIWP